METKKKVLILGAGFGGIEVARTIQTNFKKGDVSVTLISKKHYFEYYPGLYRVLSSEPPFEVFVPIKNLLPKNVSFIQEEIDSISLTDKTVSLKDTSIHTYDILVLALGSEAFYFNIRGVQEYSLGCKSLTDVRYLRNDLISKITESDTNNTPLNIVIAGGGPTGIEMAGQLVSLLKKESMIRHVSNKKITIVQGAPRLVPQSTEKVSALVLKRLKDIGVEVLLNTKIVEQKETGIIFDKGALETNTLIWTAGSQLNTVVQKNTEFTLSPRKKVQVDEYMRAVGHTSVFVVGDNADTQFSGLAQTAAYDGLYVGKQITRLISGEKLFPYTPKVGAYVMPVGKYWGVFSYKKITITGIIPHMMRYAVDIFYFFKRLSFKDFVTLYTTGRLH